MSRALSRPGKGRRTHPFNLGGQGMIPGRILFVDDEENLLASFRTTLRRHFDVHTALGPADGLRAIRDQEPFAVVVSDLKMPSMDGITFLARVREMSPDSVRMMLTGFADVQTAIGAVNEGQVFRFLTKPCPLDVLVRALKDGLEQHRLVTAERELLRGTLRGAIRVLSEALALSNPEAFGRSRRVRHLVSSLAKAANRPTGWELDLAAMLSYIGCMALPRTILEKLAAGLELSFEEQSLYDRHPVIGAGLLRQIPRMERVADLVADQHKRHADEPCEGAGLLKLAVDYDLMESRGLAMEETLQRMHDCPGCYDPALLVAFERAVTQLGAYNKKWVMVREMKPGMVLDEDVVTREGLLLLAKGLELTRAGIARLAESVSSFGVVEPVGVLLPAEEEAAEQDASAGQGAQAQPET